jgi:ketosteroid isomerase-like protein
MSQQNVETVRLALRAFDRGLDEVVEYWDPEIDWRAIEGAPDDVGVFSGRDAMRRYYEQWYETFDDLRAEAEELIDAGDDLVVASMHVVGRMKGSDAVVDMRLAIVYTVRDGLIASGREYATRKEAFEAAGLGKHLGSTP